MKCAKIKLIVIAIAVLMPLCGCLENGDGPDKSQDDSENGNWSYEYPTAPALLEKGTIFDYDLQHPSCHAATITELANGDIFAVWYAGMYEASADQVLMCSRIPFGSSGWTAPKVLYDTANTPDGNAVLFTDDLGRVWLFWNVMLGDGWDSCNVQYILSTDNANTWSEPKVMRDELGWMLRNKPIVLENGDYLLPVHNEKNDDWYSMVWISEDKGVTWQAHGHISTPGGCIQPTIVQRQNGSLLMFLRTRDSYVFKSESFDNGRTWTPAAQTAFLNSNSGIEMIKLRSGAIVMAFNNVSSGRTPMSVIMSTDDGRTWLPQKDIETASGEYSYPTMIQSMDGNIHLIYSNGFVDLIFEQFRVNMAHAKMNETWILGQ